MSAACVKHRNSKRNHVILGLYLLPSLSSLKPFCCLFSLCAENTDPGRLFDSDLGGGGIYFFCVVWWFLCFIKSTCTVWWLLVLMWTLLTLRLLAPTQTVEMHKEKVSRREIGVFTVVRRVPRSHKILPPQPASVQPRPPYSRQPINYQQLDGVGHGMKVTHT